jgi:hypothetical protein
MKILHKETWNNAFDFIQSAFTGLKLLSEAASLVITSGVTIWTAYNHSMNVWMQRVLLCAAAIIALRGAVEFMRHLARLSSPRKGR